MRALEAPKWAWSERRHETPERIRPEPIEPTMRRAAVFVALGAS